MSNANRGESVVTHEWQFTQEAESAEPCGQCQIREQQEHKQPDDWNKQDRSECRETDTAKQSVRHGVNTVDKQERHRHDDGPDGKECSRLKCELSDVYRGIREARNRKLLDKYWVACRVAAPCL